MMPRPHPAVIFQLVSEGAVLLHSETEVYFGLNQVGAQIWEMLSDPACELEDILRTLQEAYPDVGAEVIRADMQELLAELESNGLVVPASDAHEAGQATRKAPEALEPSKS